MHAESGHQAVPGAETRAQRIERCVTVLKPLVSGAWHEAQALIELTEYAGALPGHKLAPKEPTLTMVSAARMESNRWAHNDPAFFSAIWCAMWAAIPEGRAHA